MLRRSKRLNFPVLPTIVLAIVVICALFAPYIAPHNPNALNLLGRLQPPAFVPGGETTHILGTDSLGRDILSQLIYGARVSLLVGVVAVLVGAISGLLLGLLAGYFGGWIDNLIMRIADVQLAFPFILLAIALMAVLGAGLWNVILVLSLRSWVSYARVVRSEVLAVREREFIQASQAIGASQPRTLVKHVAPNVVASVIVIGSLSVAQTIIAEASLSFLGLGVGVNVATWGSIISAGQDYLVDAWWIAAMPGLAIIATVLSVNLMGDWLRDYLDPKTVD